MVWRVGNQEIARTTDPQENSQIHCLADHRRTVFWKHCAGSRLFGQNRGWWPVHNLTGALIVHLPDGWGMNWFGEKKGEGIEYHVMLLSLLLIVIVRGSGAMSIDLWLTHLPGM